MGQSSYDVVLVGAGVMSATLAALLHELDPSLRIALFERLDDIARESSAAMNNAGTGHAAYCELNYTPQAKNGSISIAKAVDITESFELSKQFRAHLIYQGYISSPQEFIHRMPHCSLVFGEEDVNFLRRRYETMQSCPLFHGMVYSEDPETIAARMPLVMQGRDGSIPVAATHMFRGTDIDFGALTHGICTHLAHTGCLEVYMRHEVTDLKKTIDNQRNISVHDLSQDSKKTFTAPFVFLGAGGKALSLLQKSSIPEGKTYGGFPVSGQRLVCTNETAIAQHGVKVYGKASLGAPPMSVPHLDTRSIAGKKHLLFGPYAGWTTKFLKQGSFFDLFGSIRLGNIRSLFGAGVHNIPLTRYLLQQLMQSKQDRLQALHIYYPGAKEQEWEIREAGYRVQLIKADKQQGGMLQFGTEVVISQDKSLATLLGASPGASTSVAIMLEIITTCFPKYTTISSCIPSYGKKLADDHVFAKEIRDWSETALDLSA